MRAYIAYFFPDYDWVAKGLSVGKTDTNNKVDGGNTRKLFAYRWLDLSKDKHNKGQIIKRVKVSLKLSLPLDLKDGDDSGVDSGDNDSDDDLALEEELGLFVGEMLVEGHEYVNSDRTQSGGGVQVRVVGGDGGTGTGRTAYWDGLWTGGLHPRTLTTARPPHRLHTHYRTTPWPHLWSWRTTGRRPTAARSSTSRSPPTT